MLSEKPPVQVGLLALLKEVPCGGTSITTAVSCELTNSSSFLRARQLSGVDDGSKEEDVDDWDVDNREALAIVQVSSSGRRCARCIM
jgi:hypothetical protein